MAHFQYKEQQFQKDAVNAVADVFRGVDFAPVLAGRGFALSADNAPCEVGIAHHRYVLSNFGEVVAGNLREVQKQNGIAAQPSLSGAYPVLDTQMETGTGKTFTFINAIFEMHKRHGLTHFIVIVPSVAIREGVKKSFATTAQYFERIYHRRVNVREMTAARQKKGRKAPPSGVSDFIHASGLTALVMTSHSFNRTDKGKSKGNIIHQELEGFFAGDAKTPMAAIAAKNPVLIIDEPHRVEGKQTQGRIADFNPLFILRYSATFKTMENPVYALDSYEAFDKKLVKAIAVSDYQTAAADAAFLGVNRITTKGAELTAADVNGKPVIVSIPTPDARIAKGHLHAKTKNPEYADMRITAINRGAQTITLSDGRTLEAGKYEGRESGNDGIIDEVMISDTIRRHLRKERELFARGVKCISLFFIDHVRDYRDYESASGRGRLQLLFEKCYKQCAQEAMKDAPEEYQNYLRRQDASTAHGGYFSGDAMRNKKIDEGKAGKDNDEARKLQQEITELILRDKEEVLRPDNKLRFIFAHSALREGWDNPNVFQICKLRTGYSEIGRVQEVGRGLRLCVNGDLARMDADALGNAFAAVNRLDVFTLGEGRFIAGLQQDLSDRRCTVKAGYLEITAELLQKTYGIRYLDASRLVVKIADAGCIDDDGRLLTRDDIGEILAAAQLDANKLLAKLPKTPDITNAREDGKAPKKYRASESHYAKFKELWRMLHQKVVYRVEYSPDFTGKIIERINKDLHVPPLYLNVTTGEVRAEDGGFDARTQQNTRDVRLKSTMTVRLFLARLEEKTRLPRNTIIDILSAIRREKFDELRAHPFAATDKLADIINGVIYQNIVDNIRYIKRDGLRQSFITLTDREFHARQYLALDEVDDYAGNNLWEAIAPYDSIDPEKMISEDALVDKKIIVFAKLPRAVNIPAPMHPKGINPDFAFVVPGKDGKQFYFVAEAKPTTDIGALAQDAKRRAEFMDKYFQGIGEYDIQFKVVSSYADLRQLFADNTGDGR